MFPDDYRERKTLEETLDMHIKLAPSEWATALVGVKDTFHAMLLTVKIEGFGNDQLLALELTRLVIKLRNFEKQSLPDDLE